MAAAIIALLAAYVVTLVLDYGFGIRRQGGLRWLASLDMEGNPQAWYQTLSMFGCAALLTLCGAVARGRGERHAGDWYGVAALFAFASLDEMSSLHERISEPLRSHLGADGPFFFAWILAWGAALLVVALVHARWLLSLPAPSRLRFLVAALTFVAGAIGFEMLEARLYSATAELYQLPYELLILCEEALEMLGILLFVRMLLLHLEEVAGLVELRLGSVSADGAASA